MNKQLLKLGFIFLFYFFVFSAHAQVGFNNPSPDASSLVDLKAIDKGLLIPRMTSSQRINITTPALGLLVFDTEQKKFFFYDGAKWLALNPFDYRQDQSPAQMPTTSDLVTNIDNVKNVGVSTNTPQSKLSVSGNAAIGATYAGANAAPANSLIVEGNVGIGTPTTGTNRLQVEGTTQINGDLTSSATITANTLSATNIAVTGASGAGVIPKGGIIMWSGNTAPAGWALCDGTNGTPDLRGRFIVGFDARGAGAPAHSDPTYNQAGNLSTGGVIAGTIGGEKVHILSVAEMPTHDHTGTTSVNGQHRHDLGTDINGGGPLGDVLLDGDADEIGDHLDTNTVQPAGNHSHTIPPQGDGAAHENRPPYYVLAFIMKL